MSSKRRRKKARVPGLIITIILLLLVAEFVGLLAITKLLPVYLLFAVGIVFMTCVLLVAMLTGNFREESPIYYRCNSGRSASCNSAFGQSLCDEHL